MKKRILIGLLVILTILATLSIVACSGGGGGNETYTVTFDTSNSIQGKDAVPSQTVQSGGKVTEPDIELTRYNCVFIGWYNGSKKWDFAKDTVTSDITLKATFQGVAPPCDHNYVETERKNPTCQADGYYVMTCSKCRRFERFTKNEDLSMAKLEHVVQTETVEPSCGVDGYIRTFCDNGCGLNQRKTLESTGHHDYAVDENGDYVWKTVLAPTKYVSGLVKRNCTTCGLGEITETRKYEANQTSLFQLSIVNFKYTGGAYDNEPFVNVAEYGRVSVSSFFTSAKGNLINDGDVDTFWTADTYADGSDFTKDYFEIEWDKEYITGAIQLTVPNYSAWELGDECYVSYMLSYWDDAKGEYIEYREFSDKEAVKAGLSGEILVTFPEPIVTKKFKADVTYATRYAPATVYEINVYAKTEEMVRTPMKATGGAILSVSGKYSEWVKGADALPDGLLSTGWTTDARYNNGDEWAMYEYSKETFISNVQFTTKANATRSFLVQFWIDDPTQPEGGRWINATSSLLAVPQNAEEAKKDEHIIRYGYDSMAFNGTNVPLGTNVCTFNVTIEAKTTKVKLVIVSEPVYWEAYIHDFIPYTVQELAEGEEKTELCPHTNARPVKVDYVDVLGNQKQKDKIIDPTCTSAGYAVYQCQGGACSHIMTTNATDATGHHFGEYEVVNAATGTTLGLKQSKCTECDAVRSMNYLEEYEAPTITDYYHNATGGWAQSFDDGNYMDTYTWAIPMLQKYNYKATMMMSITFGEGFVKEWTEHFSTGAFDLGSHSYNHGGDYAYDPIYGNLIREVVSAQYWFRSTFPGQKCIVFAAPLGQTSEGVADYLCGPLAANRNGGQTGVYMNMLDHLENRITAGNTNSWISKMDQTEGTYVLVDTKNAGKTYKEITETRQVIENGKPKVDKNGNPVMETVIIGYVVHKGSYSMDIKGQVTELQGTDGNAVLMPNQHGKLVYAKKNMNYIYDAELGTFDNKGISQSGYRYDPETYQFILDSSAGYEIIETDTGKTFEVGDEQLPIYEISIEYKPGGTYKLVKTTVGSYEAYIDKIVEKNAWTVECLHSLGSGSIHSSYDSTISKFDYLKVKGVWACSYNEIVQYRRQYSNSQVNLVEQTDSRIEVSLTDTVDNVMFDHALTIKIDIPNNWTNVVVKQGDRVIEQVTLEEYKDDMTKVNCTISDGYIYVDAYPDSDNITIELQ